PGVGKPGSPRQILECIWILEKLISHTCVCREVFPKLHPPTTCDPSGIKAGLTEVRRKEDEPTKSKPIIFTERIVRLGVDLSIGRTNVFRRIKIVHPTDVGRPFRSEEFRFESSGNVDFCPPEVVAKVDVGGPYVDECITPEGPQTIARLDISLNSGIAVGLGYAARNVIGRAGYAEGHTELSCGRHGGWGCLSFYLVFEARSSAPRPQKHRADCAGFHHRIPALGTSSHRPPPLGCDCRGRS